MKEFIGFFNINMKRFSLHNLVSNFHDEEILGAAEAHQDLYDAFEVLRLKGITVNPECVFSKRLKTKKVVQSKNFRFRVYAVYRLEKVSHWGSETS